MAELEEVECPICGQSHMIERVQINGRNIEVSDLCSTCDDNRFYLDDEREVKYRAEVKTRVEELKKLFGDDYNDKLHATMVEQMVRCELSIERYDQLISNDNEAPQTAELLKSERAQWNKLSDKLMMTINKIRGDTKKIEHDFTDDFKQYMKNVLGSDDEE